MAETRLEPEQYFVVGDNRGMPMELHTLGTVAADAVDRSGGVVNRTALARGLALPALSWRRTSSGAGSSTSDEDRVREAVDGLAATLSTGRPIRWPGRRPRAAPSAAGRGRRRDHRRRAPRFAAATRSPACGSGCGRRPVSTGCVPFDVSGRRSAEAGDTATAERRRRDSRSIAAASTERDLHEVRVTLVAAGGEWLVSRAAVVDAVSPPR